MQRKATLNHSPWLAYVARYCEFVPVGLRYLLYHLAARPEAEALARQYVETWATAADAEPQPQPPRPANAGRRAANAMLRCATPPPRAARQRQPVTPTGGWWLMILSD